MNAMNQPHDHSSVARALADAYRTREPIAPPRELIDGLDVAGAYRIQQLQEQQFLAEGQVLRGRKIGLTSLAMQQQLGVDSPDFGFFTNAMMYPAMSIIPTDRFIAPKVEPELAFRLGADLSASATMEEVIAAIDGTFLAVEIIDSRVRDWDIRLVDTIADNASCGAVVLSKEPVAIAPEDLPAVTATMVMDGQPAGSGTGAAVMGHPLQPLVWLAHTLGEQGVALTRGNIILTGSFCGATPIVPGGHLTVDYGPYGHLSMDFTNND